MGLMDYILNTPGIGGLLALAVIVVLVTTYGLTLVWISKGYEDEIKEK
jgi:hypothetical protein